MARTKKTEPKAETTTAEETPKGAPVAPETPKADEDKGENENPLEKRIAALEKRVAELERVTAYRKPVTSADILGL